MTALWVNNTNTVELDGLVNAEDGTPIAAGYAVSIALSQGGTVVAGPITLSLVPGTANTWRGRVAHDASLEHRGRYEMQVVAYSAQDGVRGEWNDVVTAMIRGVR